MSVARSKRPLVQLKKSNRLMRSGFVIGFKLVALIFIFITPKDFYSSSLNSVLMSVEPVGALHSINYGISQQSITDVGLLMPKPCQNQESICEGSFGVCINRVKRCICDLRMPVQVGRFCLRQVDLDTKCFATSQCNHTIKDAVCIDINTNVVLDHHGSNSKLEQWHKLNELKQMSQSTLTNDGQSSQATGAQVVRRIRNREAPARTDGKYDSWRHALRIEPSDNAMVSNSRNSPYELSFTASELMVQNHTMRQRANFSDRAINEQITNLAGRSQSDPIPREKYHPPAIRSSSASTISAATTTTTVSTTTTSTIISTTDRESPSARSSRDPFDLVTLASDSGASITTETSETSTNPLVQQSPQPPSQQLQTLSSTTSSYDHQSSYRPPALSPNNELIRADEHSTRPTITPNQGSMHDQLAGKKIIKTIGWPPGLCSCSPGFMFDSMVRKCLALSLADSHCITDSDCRQIVNTHCSATNRKCECDEPLSWDNQEMACLRPKALMKGTDAKSSSAGGFIDTLVSSLIAAKLFPNQMVLLFCFVLVIIVATLILLRLTVKCFTSSNSALISPKGTNNKKRQHNKRGASGDTDNLTGPSPYATLRRPDHKPSSQLSNFTRATRGRILNYDFEQESPKMESASRCQSPQQEHQTCGSAVSNASLTLKRATSSGPDKEANFACSSGDRVATIKSIKSHKPSTGQNQHHHGNNNDEAGELDERNGVVELNDNISISQAESEEPSILSIPGPPPGQQPPYMLASSMKGQGSAIAAAAAAVANKRMLAAQKKKFEHAAGGLNGLSSAASSGFTNGTSPVYL